MPGAGKEKANLHGGLEMAEMIEVKLFQVLPFNRLKIEMAVM